ncbi:hypothetical protein ASPZODRAFT_144206 [Penicilliopsis zonata CBS 506.65]|uniref:Uncharacterized protein n=1 Tax=Penicilliopsis zonata CBS 506.65 TaxID=1073090 RepID=A0A1L9SCK1_9EURO|nr:hypothetical protein ASPZODRAFT_144206 [Penicilliopsis zonata CBS 506.65]OJJ44873.1 hypothetical protein ASPZODRAFT_144206 [Penicilliopsis zonata CBS 506.65]
MPRPKSFLKESKKKKTAQRTPRSADEFLAAGVELEEAGEKWRAGDATKSMRFFMRAIALYDEGLQAFPTAFDLAYNKARVQYETTQHPKLVTQLSAPLADVLRITLQSHRDALALDQDNADVLFNTAQVLTSLAEATTDTKHPADDQLAQAIQFLQEAIELFQRCLLLQELRYTESQEQIRLMEAEMSGQLQEQEHKQEQEIEHENEQEQEQEQWAAIVEPVTKNTLVDTAVAQLETLTTLCNLLVFTPGVGLAWVEEYSTDLYRAKIAAYAQGSDRNYEAAVAHAKFTCALSEVLYRSGRIEIDTYHREIGRAFGAELDLSADPDALCSKGEALASFNTAVADLPPAHDADALSNSLALRWQALSLALDALTAATKLPDVENLPKIHIGRGDAELGRWRLGAEPWNYSMAKENAAVLLKNAQTYYRGAAALARRDGAVEEEKEGTCKEAIAAALGQDTAKLEQLKMGAPQELSAVAEDMIDDGLVPPIIMQELS